MRKALIFTSLALVASPALAQTASPPPPAADAIVIPPQLSDPRFVDRLTDVMHAMSKAFLNLPVGEVEAAIEGRRPTRSDRRRTVRSETGISERELDRQIEGNRVVMQAGMKAMVAALPAMTKALTDASREIEKATANLPSPVYPNR